MGGFRLLDLVKFFLPILPEVELPIEKIAFDERIVYTVGSAVIFLFGQLPIFGLKSNAQFYINDPFYSVRSIVGMEKGTLLELGLLPVVTGAFIWQLAAGLRLINVNLGLRYDRELFQTGQKLTAFILAICYTIELISSGYYDNAIRGYDPLNDSTPFGTYALIFTQVAGWSWFTTLLVEIFDKGYGFGSGALCFLALQNATNFIADVLGLEVIPIINSNKTESLGALVNLIRNFKLFSPKQTATTIWHAFTRVQLPNLTQFYIAVLSIAVFIGLQNFRIEIPIRSTKVRGMNNVFPIKLLYTGGLPVLFAFTVLMNIQMFAYSFTSLLSKLGAPEFLIPILAKYETSPTSNNLVLTSGIFSYFTSSTSLVQSLLAPIRTVVYSASIIFLAVWFANKWSYVSGSAPKDISKQFKDQGISISGKRDVSVTKELARVIPVASVSGAFLLAATCCLGEFLGGLGKGVAATIGVSSAFGVLEEFMIEYQQSGGSQFTNALSGLQQ
ncbi:SSH1 [[Candida] subhashii]|uniref:SSH1 n=1 Tax=[Candida] subhashii TaxID=561895 RepID=A0A8J5QFF1_9ASCO|nr:SSH1 [[Candida] subhashii]KAG7661074.1 SSH1 [[Candida] subhashii]